jgi:hypothetical protein
MIDCIEVDLSGDYDTTIYDVARRLLSAGADPSVATWRNAKRSMSGVVGELAKWTVAGNPALHLVRWKAFPRDAVRARTGKAPPPAIVVALGMEGPP